MKVKLKPIKESVVEMEVKDMLREILDAGRLGSDWERGYNAMQNKINEFRDRLVD